MLFATLRETPERGSLQESVLMMYVLQKEKVEHARLRALAQITLAKEKGKEAFEDYMKIAFPWLETQKKRDREDHVRVLMEEVKKGGLALRPLGSESKIRSRLRMKVVERNEQTLPREKAEKLYDKLGKIIPV